MDYYLSSLHGDREGIGDFLVKFPAIDYYTIEKGDTVYIECAEKFKCLLPDRKNLIVGPHGKGTTIPFDPHNEYHVSAGWLPRISQFENNYLFKEPFVYPRIKCGQKLIDELKEKYNKPIISYVRQSSDKNRNWSNDKWDILIEKLSKDFLCVEVGSHHIKNSDDYYVDKNSLSIGNDLSLLEIACIMKISECFIGCNSGPFHLSVAIGTRKTIVITNNNNDKNWLYPNTIEIKSGQDDIEQILEKIYE